jgi:hypothetical protein
MFQPDLLSNIKPVERVNMIEVKKESNLQFDIQTDSTVYLNDKPIFLKMRITNKADSAIFINKRFIVNTPEAPKESAIGEVYLIITSPAGDTLSFNAFVHVSYPNQNDYVALGPGKNIVSAHKEDINSFYDFGQNGEYKITGYYYNFYKEGIKPAPWEGKIKSNTIKILIR